MKNLFLPYELAILAKQKGFNEPCFGFYTEEYKQLIFTQPKIHNSSDLPTKPFNAPMSQQILDWFRDKHAIEIQPFQLSKTQAAYGISFLECYPKKYNKKDMVDYSNTTAIINQIELEEKRNIKIPSAKEIAAQNYTYYEALNKALEEAFKLINSTPNSQL